MELLRLLTLIYAGILVLALAVSLLAVLIYLRRIAAVLAEAKRSLSLVQQRTLPMEEHLAPLANETARVRTMMAEAAKHLVFAYERVAALSERMSAFARGSGQRA